MSDRPESLGPYRLLDSLGQGGMGVVYRAVHETTGEAVAVKTVRVPERNLLAGIRREIHALARLDHPGIIRILDDGFERGLPWYAMELVDGVPLLAAPVRGGTWWTEHLAGTAPPTRLLADQWQAPTRTALGEIDLDTAVADLDARPSVRPSVKASIAPRDLGSKLTLVRRLCSALAYLHGEGLVHRDLKPENILVRGDGMPVIVDFGITTRFGDEQSREALHVEIGTFGTAAYMAPEQVLGELVDARADLYSLGCILYELLTGRRPFLAASLSVMLHKQLAAVPLAPSAIARDVPAELDDLVLRLLEKQPERRLGHADDVAAALVRLGADEAMPDAVPRARAYLYRPRLCGRMAEFERLEVMLANVGAGAGAVALVGGESGVGKTRLVVELGRRAGYDGAVVLSGECAAASSEGEAALMPFRQPLREIVDLCREEGLETSERVFGARGPMLAVYEPAVATLPGQSDHPPPPDIAGIAALDQLFDALAATLRELAAMRRLVLILDNLQWADELTLGFLAYSVERRVFESSPVLIVGTYRSEEVEGEGFGHRYLRALVESDGVATIDLTRMDAATVQAMVGEMLALAPPPDRFSQFLSEHSEGNPFFVAEYLRASVAEGVLHRKDGTWRVTGDERALGIVDAGRRPGPAPWELLALPRSLRELVARRLEGLDADSRRLVDAGAILGREMDAELLRRVARIGRERALDCLHDLVRRQVLEDHGRGAVRFVHDKLREVAFERLTPSRRRRLHGTAAREMERRPVEENAEWQAALGAHWEGAGEPARARGYYLAAARLAAARYAHAQAEVLYRRYLALVDRPSVDSVSVRNELADKVLSVWGLNAEAVSEYLEALDETRALGDLRAEAETLYNLAQVYRGLGRIEECRTACEEGLAIYRALGDTGGEGRALGLLGLVFHFHDGRLDEAQTAYDAALDLTRRAGDRLGEGRTLSNLGGLMIIRGEYERARALIENAIAVLREIGAISTVAAAMSNLPLISSAQGRLDEAIARHEEALEMSRVAGFSRFEGINLSNLAALLLRKGRNEEARVRLEQALAIHRRIGHRRFEGMSLAHLGDYYFLGGELERAEATFAEALAIHREVGNREFEGETLSALADCRAERDDLDGARALYVEALDLHREIGDVRDCGITISHLAAIERRAGRFEEADALLGEAEEYLEQRGDSFFIAIAMCERGHLNLARGLTAGEILERASALALALDTGPTSSLGRAIDRLSRAIREHES